MNKISSIILILLIILHLNKSVLLFPNYLLYTPISDCYFKRNVHPLDRAYNYAIPPYADKSLPP